MKQTVFIVLMLILISLLVNPVQAAPPGQAPAGEAYIVQAGDWLSKIAEKYYGDRLAYPAIVKATNARAAEDKSFAVIQNPDVLAVGQKLWLPPAAEVSLAQAAAPPNTEVIHYIPEIPSQTKAGHCWTSSVAAPGSPFAWRCMVGNLISDPCLTAMDRRTIVCGVPDQEFVLQLTEPLPAPNSQAMAVQPWQLELTNGATCRPFTGTLPPLEETARYGCDDQTVILGELQQGPVWSARRATLVPNESGPLPYKVGREMLIPIGKVWLVGDPTKSGG